MLRILSLLLTLTLAAPALAAEPSTANQAQAAIDAIYDGQDVHAQISRIFFLKREKQAAVQLARGLHADSVDVRRRCAEALARLATPAQLGALKSASEDEDGAVRMSVAQALARAGPRAAPVLHQLAADPTYGVRREAARAMGKVGTSKDGVTLFGRLKDEPELEVRIAIVLAAGESGAKSLRPQLVQLQGSDSEGTRQAATRALCLMGASEGLDAVRKQLQGTELYARLAAVELLAGVPLKIASPLLKPLLDVPEPKLQAAAARTLAQAGEGKARTWLILAAEHAGPGKRGPYIAELERLGVTEVESNAVLRKVGLK